MGDWEGAAFTEFKVEKVTLKKTKMKGALARQSTSDKLEAWEEKWQEMYNEADGVITRASFKAYLEATTPENRSIVALRSVNVHIKKKRNAAFDGISGGADTISK